MRKQTIVVHSGGMDSSLCLALAIREFGPDEVLSLGFTYGQRHSLELERAAEICKKWNVDRVVIDINCLAQVTEDALTNHNIDIKHEPGKEPNTLVVGRNGLMARIAAIHANSLGATSIYMGVIEVESANSGYRDCSRAYMDLMQEIMRIDLGVPGFEIRTPIARMTKRETMDLGHEMEVLTYLLDRTITCYEGVPQEGCRACPACVLRNTGLADFLGDHPEFKPPYVTASRPATERR